MDIRPIDNIYAYECYLRANQEIYRFSKESLDRAVRLIQNGLDIVGENELLVYLSAIAGKGDVSRALLPKLLEIDPLTPLFQCFAGWIEYMEGNFVGALVSIPKMFKMEPENLFYGVIYTNFLTRTQRFEEAYPIIDMLVKAAPQTYFAQLALFRKLALQGKKKEALKIMTPELKDWVRWDERFSWEIAASYALLDQKREALDWLENAVDRGFINYPFLNEYDPLLENIRSEDGFERLMKRVKHEWESFKV